MLLYIFATPSSHLFFFFFFVQYFSPDLYPSGIFFLIETRTVLYFYSVFFRLKLSTTWHSFHSYTMSCQFHSRVSITRKDHSDLLWHFHFFFFFPFIFFSHLYFFLPSSSFFFFFFFLSPRLNSTLIAKVCTDPRLSSGGIEFCLAAKFPTRSPLISDRKLNGY